MKLKHIRSSSYPLANDQLRVDSAEWWEDDGVEIYIDGDNSGGNSYDGQNDYLIAVRPGSSTLYVSGTSVPPPSSMQVGQSLTDGGYRVEIKIPLSEMGYRTSNRGRFGFDVHINDDDNGGGRDGKIGWYATVDDSWQRPGNFGPALLMDKFVYIPSIFR